jgi:plastocyanin
MTAVTRLHLAFGDNPAMRTPAGKILIVFSLLAAPVCAWASGHIVNVGGTMTVFTPSTLTIAAGDSVTFVNKGGNHNVAADNGAFRCARGCDGKGGNGNPSNSNWVASVTFANPGTFGYFCEIHGTPTSGMHGAIIVQTSTPVQLQSFEVD